MVELFALRLVDYDFMTTWSAIVREDKVLNQFFWIAVKHSLIDDRLEIDLIDLSDGTITARIENIEPVKMCESVKYFVIVNAKLIIKNILFTFIHLFNQIAIRSADCCLEIFVAFIDHFIFLFGQPLLSFVDINII